MSEAERWTDIDMIRRHSREMADRTRRIDELRKQVNKLSMWVVNAFIIGFGVGILSLLLPDIVRWTP